MGFVANFIRLQALQKFWKSVKIWQICREFKVGNLFETQCRVGTRHLLTRHFVSTSIMSLIAAGEEIGLIK